MNPWEAEAISKFADCISAVAYQADWIAAAAVLCFWIWVKNRREQ